MCLCVKAWGLGQGAWGRELGAGSLRQGAWGRELGAESLGQGDFHIYI